MTQAKPTAAPTGQSPLVSSAPVRPFLNWPVVTEAAQWQADVMVIGLPLSEPYPGQPFPNDQAQAPDAIRLQSGQFCDGATHWDFDLGAPLGELLPPRCIDAGNVVWSGRDYDSYFSQVRDSLANAFAHGTQVITFGGDHGVTIPVLAALERVGRPVYIVHIDAHLDWRDDVNGVRRGYSSPLRRASELACVKGMTQMGLRGTGSARREEFEKARAYGAQLITAAEVHRDGIASVLGRIPGGISVYVTIDADGLDPTGMPGVMAPVPGGLYARQVMDLLLALARRNPIVGMDIVEIAPSFDFVNKLTCITAGRLALSVIGASWGAGGARLQKRQ